jgi:hypothetical protein
MNLTRHDFQVDVIVRQYAWEAFDDIFHRKDGFQNIRSYLDVALGNVAERGLVPLISQPSDRPNLR